MISRAEAKEQLERILDSIEEGRNGVAPQIVTDLLSEICTEKAEHVRTTWQDNVLARVWDRYARQFNSTAIRLEGAQGRMWDRNAAQKRRTGGDLSR